MWRKKGQMEKKMGYRRKNCEEPNNVKSTIKVGLILVTDTVGN